MSYKKVSRALMLLTVVCTTVGLCFTSGASAQADTGVDISPAGQTVSPGQVFTVDVVVNPAVPIAGVEFDLSFDPSLLAANSVAEGNLLNQNDDLTFFLSGTIDNGGGTITGVAGAILGAGATVSSPGTFATITFTAKATAGISPLGLSNVTVGDVNGDPVAIVVTDGSVTIDVPATPIPIVTPTPPPGPIPTTGSTPTPTTTPTPAAGPTPTLGLTPTPTPTLAPTPEPTPTPTPTPVEEGPFNLWVIIGSILGVPLLFPLLLGGLVLLINLWRRVRG